MTQSYSSVRLCTATCHFITDRPWVDNPTSSVANCANRPAGRFVTMLKTFPSAVRLAATYWSYRHRKFSSREALESWQDRKTRDHLRFVVKHSRYYRELFERSNLGDWRSLPITDKRSMMANFDSFNTLGIRAEQAMTVARTAEETRNFRPKIGDTTVGLSSGTSGNGALFLSSSRENSEFIAAAVAKLMRGNPLARQRIAFFHRAHSNLYQDLDTGRLRHQFFDLSDQLESHFSRLKEFAPTLIIGPPYALCQLGVAKSAGRLIVSPRGLLSVAETLAPDVQAQIESHLACESTKRILPLKDSLRRPVNVGRCTSMKTCWSSSDNGLIATAIALYPSSPTFVDVYSQSFAIGWTTF